MTYTIRQVCYVALPYIMENDRMTMKQVSQVECSEEILKLCR